MDVFWWIGFHEKFWIRREPDACRFKAGDGDEDMEENEEEEEDQGTATLEALPDVLARALILSTGKKSSDYLGSGIVEA